MLYSCTHMATVGVKGLDSRQTDRDTDYTVSKHVLHYITAVCLPFTLHFLTLKNNVLLFIHPSMHS